MRATFLLLVLTTLACGQAFHSPSVTTVLLQESFSKIGFRHEWTVESPNVTGISIRLRDGAMVLTMPSDGGGEITMRRKVDVSPMRGKRIRITARVRTEGSATSFARATLSLTTDGAFPSYRDSVSTSSVNSVSWTNIQAVMVRSQSITLDCRAVRTGGTHGCESNVESTGHFHSCYIAIYNRNAFQGRSNERTWCQVAESSSPLSPCAVAANDRTPRSTRSILSRGRWKVSFMRTTAVE
jgi:hypothetical protein